MRRPEYASVRLTPGLKRELAKIASANSQTLSRTIELLVRRGLKQYRRDGLLIEARKTAGEADAGDSIEAVLHRLVPEVAKIIRKRLEAELKTEKEK